MQTILLLEDDETLREVLEDALSDAGYGVHAVSSAAEALRTAESLAFDGVISDVRMAGSQDGLDVLSKLKEKNPGLPCIVMTGFADELAPMRAATIMVDDYLYKPFDVEELFQSLDRAKTAARRQADYRAMLSKLLSQEAHDGALAPVRATREAALNALFVAIRSATLTVQRTLNHWDELERLELLYIELLRTPETDAAAAQSLLTSYQHWVSSLFSKSRKSAKNRGENPVDPAVFERFFRRVKAGEIGPEDLGMAVCLRKAPRERLEAFPAQQALWAQFWGPA